MEIKVAAKDITKARVDVAIVNMFSGVKKPTGATGAIDEALDRLAAEDELKAQIVKLRYFAGLSHNEIASALGLSEPTVRRHWAFARSWLYADLKFRFKS